MDSDTRNGLGDSRRVAARPTAPPRAVNRQDPDVVRVTQRGHRLRVRLVRRPIVGVAVGVGRFHRTPVTVALSNPRDGHFVKMTLRGATFGVDTRCNPPGITYWTIPSGPPGDTSCRGASP